MIPSMPSIDFVVANSKRTQGFRIGFVSHDSLFSFVSFFLVVVSLFGNKNVFRLLLLSSRSSTIRHSKVFDYNVHDGRNWDGR